jgi:hypothetical protein
MLIREGWHLAVTVALNLENLNTIAKLARSWGMLELSLGINCI